jgi:3',5'-cyclic-AMP phosphodiesterase
MRRPFLLVQLSDPHIGADWGGGDPVAMLSAAVASVLAVAPNPDAVLVSGDLADHALDREYEQVRELLAPLDAPLYVLAGNHDDRGALRRHFGVPGADSQPVQYVAEVGPLRLVVLDSTRPGEDSGELDDDRLAWLEITLAEAHEAPTLLALHHSPLLTSIPVFDEFGLSAAACRALASVVGAHPQILRIVGGHMHRMASGKLGGRNVLAVTSTYVQSLLEFDAEEVAVSPEPSGFAVHAFADGELVSHLQPVR